MPILWRYLLKNYFQVFFLSVGTFVAVLLATRFQQIAILSTLDSNLALLTLFICCQISYILPIAIPIAGLISAILLLQRLSKTGELTAMRASGLSIKQISTPLLIAAAFLSLTTFVIASELTPRSRFLSERLIQAAIVTNPLLLLQRSKMTKMRDSYAEMAKKKGKKCARHFLFVFKDPQKGSLRLISAKNILVKKDLLIGEKVAFLSFLRSEKEADFDSLLIENEEEMSIQAATLTKHLKKREAKAEAEHLPSAHLLYTLYTMGKEKKKERLAARFELSRRLYFSVMTFSFTLLGFALGMQIGRGKKPITLFLIISLPAISLIFSLLAKSLYLHPILSISAYLVPLLLLITFSFLALGRVTRGKE